MRSSQTLALQRKGLWATKLMFQLGSWAHMDMRPLSIWWLVSLPKAQSQLCSLNLTSNFLLSHWLLYLTMHRWVICFQYLVNKILKVWSHLPLIYLWQNYFSFTLSMSSNIISVQWFNRPWNRHNQSCTILINLQDGWTYFVSVIFLSCIILLCFFKVKIKDAVYIWNLQSYIYSSIILVVIPFRPFNCKEWCLWFWSCATWDAFREKSSGQKPSKPTTKSSWVGSTTPHP